MDSQMVDEGGSLALRGILATLFGIAAVFWPGITLVTLVYLFSAFVLLNGLVDLVVGVSHLLNGKRGLMTRLLTLLFGLFEVGIGVYLLRHPTVTFATFILIIGFSLVVRGVFEVVQGLFAGGEGSHRALLVLLGIIAVIAGVVVLMQPASAGVAFVWIVGIYALVSGPLLIALGMEVNRSEKIDLR